MGNIVNGRLKKRSVRVKEILVELYEKDDLPSNPENLDSSVFDEIDDQIVVVCGAGSQDTLESAFDLVHRQQAFPDGGVDAPTSGVLEKAYNPDKNGELKDMVEHMNLSKTTEEAELYVNQLQSLEALGREFHKKQLNVKPTRRFKGEISPTAQKQRDLGEGFHKKPLKVKPARIFKEAHSIIPEVLEDIKGSRAFKKMKEDGDKFKFKKYRIPEATPGKTIVHGVELGEQEARARVCGNDSGDAEIGYDNEHAFGSHEAGVDLGARRHINDTLNDDIDIDS